MRGIGTFRNPGAARYRLVLHYNISRYPVVDITGQGSVLNRIVFSVLTPHIYIQWSPCCSVKCRHQLLSQSPLLFSSPFYQRILRSFFCWNRLQMSVPSPHGEVSRTVRHPSQPPSLRLSVLLPWTAVRSLQSPARQVYQTRSMVRNS